MLTLQLVVEQVNERGLRLLRTGDGLKVEGDCPPELAEAIREHQASLRMIAKPAPEDAAKETADDIRQQVERYAEAIVKRYLPRLTDEQLASAVDTQSPETVRDEIARLMAQASATDWACELFPIAMEVEAKHAAEAGAKAIGEPAPEEGSPF